jgi:tripartite-type tricarboxylate transporter receptor subunit TctC
MNRSFVHFFIVAVNLAFIGGSTEASKAADFYDGKTLRFVVGSAPGGG